MVGRCWQGEGYFLRSRPTLHCVTLTLHCTQKTLQLQHPDPSITSNTETTTLLRSTHYNLPSAPHYVHQWRKTPTLDLKLAANYFKQHTAQQFRFSLELFYLWVIFSLSAEHQILPITPLTVFIMRCRSTARSNTTLNPGNLSLTTQHVRVKVVKVTSSWLRQCLAPTIDQTLQSKSIV